jgi:16S rRNA (uracil1498-N3)-methyltransferase
MHTFYVPNLEGNAQNIVLSEDQSKHAIRVMRMSDGDEFFAINGRGTKALCKITVAHKVKCQAILLSSEFEKEPVKKMAIAIAPTKNMDRIEWFCEKATEIGISEIILFTSSNSERRQIKIERLEKIIVSAVKQSKRLYVPKLSNLMTFNEVLGLESFRNKYIAHCEEQDQKSLKDLSVNIDEALVLIGPEGDFSSEEISSALKSGFAPVTLGQTRLRTETAGLVACHTLLL